MNVNVCKLVAFMISKKVLNELAYLGYAIRIEQLSKFKNILNHSLFKNFMLDIEKSQHITKDVVWFINIIEDKRYRDFLRSNNICNIAIKKVTPLDVVKLYTLSDVRYAKIDDNILFIDIKYIEDTTNFYEDRASIKKQQSKIIAHLKIFNMTCKDIIVRFLDVNDVIIDESFFYKDGTLIKTSKEEVEASLLTLDNIAKEYINVNLNDLYSPTKKLRQQLLNKIEIENKLYSDFKASILSDINACNNSRDLRKILIKINDKIEHYNNEIYKLSIPPF